MTDSQRIDKLKEMMLSLITMLEMSCTREEHDLDAHSHDLLDSADRHELNKIRSEVENI